MTQCRYELLLKVLSDPISLRIHCLCKICDNQHLQRLVQHRYRNCLNFKYTKTIIFLGVRAVFLIVFQALIAHIIGKEPKIAIHSFIAVQDLFDAYESVIVFTCEELFPSLL